MPGGNKDGWIHVKPIFQSICAKADGKPDGEPCCDWVGGGGAGHYVKMVHNGIEYGDMQVLCEAYQLMKEGLGMSHEEMSNVSFSTLMDRVYSLFYYMYCSPNAFPRGGVSSRP